MRALALLLFATAAVVQTAEAQTGSITGTVSNLDGDVVPNAPIQLVNTRTNTTYKARARRPAPMLCRRCRRALTNSDNNLLGYTNTQNRTS